MYPAPAALTHPCTHNPPFCQAADEFSLNTVPFSASFTSAPAPAPGPAPASASQSPSATSPQSSSAAGSAAVTTVATAEALALAVADPSVGTVRLSSGLTLRSGPLRVARMLTVEGPEPPCPSGPAVRGLCALDARWLSRHFTVERGGALTLRRVALLAGRSVGAAGCVFVGPGGSFSASGAAFLSCLSVGAGGAVLAAGDRARADVSASAFELCASRLSFGGAVAAWGAGATAAVDSSDFRRCSAGGSGAAVAAQQGAALAVSNASFSRCAASGAGGAVALVASDGAVSGSSFEDLWAHRGGGALYAYKSATTTSGCAFSRCSCGGTPAFGGGGAVAAVYAFAAVSASSFADCTSSAGGGGAISLFVARAAVSGCAFRSSAVVGPLGAGGAVSARQAAFPQLAARWCGAHAETCSDPALTVTGSTFENNTALASPGTRARPSF